MTDVRRSVTATDPSRFKRPTTLSRRTTPNSSAQKLGRSPREREREWQDSYDERESFPQFCMACEKQFLPHDDKFLYCSEACRLYDQDAYAQDDAYKRGYGTAGHGYNYSTSGMDRPLPTRRPTGYSRPKSIELVTPMVGR
ncbi:hypothetical protein HYQ45_015623 [Verticillium longisporum]|uniref:Uncharacterized protein n=1 Tax=Verticillium longisporum TaxID=100787 RepID=A0A8I3AKM6_VERLO|nr:hypothetical protein HYQ45_015623 [Verticillium longisporum]